MPMQRLPIRRDGHDHLRDTTDEVDTRYPTTPRRVPRTNPARPIPTTDSMSDEDVVSARTDYDTQGIIALEPKPRPRPTGNRVVPARQTTGPYTKQPSAAIRQPTQSREAVRQPTQSREVARQPTQSREAVRHTTQQQVALRQPTQPRGATQRPPQQRSTSQLDEQVQQRQFHWLVPVGITMLIAIACYLLLYGTWVGGKNLYNDWAYGAGTRTYHLEAVVGDHDSTGAPTHFIATNIHGSIDVLELPGGDITHAKAFPGPHLLWSNADRAVVTLEVKDINGDNKQDIIVHVQGDTDLLFHQTTANFVLYNNGSGFSSMTALK